MQQTSTDEQVTVVESGLKQQHSLISSPHLCLKLVQGVRRGFNGERLGDGAAKGGQGSDDRSWLVTVASLMSYDEEKG